MLSAVLVQSSVCRSCVSQIPIVWNLKQQQRHGDHRRPLEEENVSDSRTGDRRKSCCLEDTETKLQSVRSVTRWEVHSPHQHIIISCSKNMHYESHSFSFRPDSSSFWHTEDLVFKMASKATAFTIYHCQKCSLLFTDLSNDSTQQKTGRTGIMSFTSLSPVCKSQATNLRLRKVEEVVP